MFAFFGYNESYAGQQGLSAFQQQLGVWIAHDVAQKYNGKYGLRIVLCSPIAHETLRNPDLPDGVENNKRLELYTRAMAEVAHARGVTFVDLFTPSAQLYASASTPLTIQGIHLNSEGNRQISQIIDRALFGEPPAYEPSYLERLRQAVKDKDLYWFHRYRTTDGFATYGDRPFLTFLRGNPRNFSPEQAAARGPGPGLPPNSKVLQREISVLDVMTSNRDRRIWAVAGRSDVKAV